MSLNPYIEIAQLFIPAKYSTVISITKSAVEILSTVKTKFQPEYNSIINAKNYQTENPALYSQLFQGSLTQETIKRKSITTKLKCINEIDNFIKKYSFTNQLNMIQICKEFYQVSLNCCVIDLQKILQELPKFTSGNKSITLNEEFLNSSMDELSLLLIEYTKGQFISEEIEDEFYQNFAYLQNDIYNSIILAIKKENKAMYKQLVNQIKKFYKSELKNQILLETCTFIRELKIPLHQMKCLIQNFFKQNQKYLQDELQNFYHFQLSNVIITRYAKKILDHQEFKIKSALQVLLQKTHYIEELSQKCSSIFLEYFKQKELMSLMYNDSQHVFYLLLQCDDDSDEFIKLLDFLLKHHNLSLTEEQRNAFTIKGDQRQYHIKEQFTKEIQEANLYWRQNVGEMINLKVLFDFYTILSGNCFVQNAFQIGHFKPQNFFLLQKLAQYFNNGLYGYLNNKVIEQFQLCMGDIFQQLLHIEKKDQIKLIIQENVVTDFHIISESRDDLIQFQNKHNFISLLIKQDKGEVEKQLKKFLREVNDEYLKKLDVPNNLSFSLASPKARFTNNITLFIPGFSESQIEGQILQTLSENYTTFMVNWDYDKDNSSWGEMLKDAIKLVILKNPLEAVASGLKAYTNAPFERASKEAKIVGQHLAYLIMEKKIFGDCQINVVAYSMGGLVMYEMMKVLDKVYNTKIINDIMILGGMVDTRKLQKRRWNCVFGNIYNIYSKKDVALKLLGMSFKMSNQMCGLNEVNLGYKGIQNLNMSNQIGGQKEYGQQIKEILIQCDFQLYLRWLYE